MVFKTPKISPLGNVVQKSQLTSNASACCCEVIDPNAYYCVRTRFWLFPIGGCIGMPTTTNCQCASGASFAVTGRDTCHSVGGFVYTDIIGGPYDTLGECQTACALIPCVSEPV